MILRSGSLGRLGSLAGVACWVAIAGCSSAEPRTGFESTPTDPSGTPPEEVLPPPQPERTGCAREAYVEDLPTHASLTDLQFSPTNVTPFLSEALSRRYPIGKHILEGGIAATSIGDCIQEFLEASNLPDDVLRQAATLVHECGHFFDLAQSKGSTNVYVMRPDLKFSCKGGDTTSRGGKMFARSRIAKDQHAQDRPACNGSDRDGCDFYADTYLNGDPDDKTFESGDQGYNFLVEEATQYVNSLASALAFDEVYSRQRVSERDGILTFLWYIERYLQLARTDHPDAYEAITSDPCWRQLTLSIWDRGWFYLRASEKKESLGLDAERIQALVTNPTLVQEIDALRRLECQ